MPNRPIDEYWKTRALILLLNSKGPRLSGRKIARILEDEATKEGRNDWPSERTVLNWMKEEREKMSSEERRQYQFVYWPESFLGNPDLPWEAAPVVLEAIRQLEREGGGRPTVRTAEWLWRLRLAAPNESVDFLLSLAQILSVKSTSSAKLGDIGRWVEKLLLHPDSNGEQITLQAPIEVLETEGLFAPLEEECEE